MNAKHRLCSPSVFSKPFVLLVILLVVGRASTSQATPLPSQTYKLAITYQAGNASIQWIGQAATLEQSPDLINWSVAGTNNPFLVLPTDRSRFYRLKLPPPLTLRPKLLRGYIAAQVNNSVVGSGTNNHRVPLPGVEVYLRNASSGAVGVSVLTDLSGRFTLPATTDVGYQICWQAPGFVTGCTPQVYVVGGGHLHVGTIEIAPSRDKDMTVVYGKVRLQDGSIPRLLEPLANINAFATVELLDAAGHSLQESYVNNFGEYLMPRVPNKSPIILRAKMENSASDSPISPEANLAGASFHPINLEIRNHPPRLQDLFAADPATGRWLKTLRLGRTARLTAHATDPDGDPVKFRWLVQAGSGALSSLVGPEVIWTPPNTQGLYSVTVIAYDKKGGYARSTYPLRVDDLGLPFSGKVDAVDAPGGVAGAQIEVNGQVTATGADGSFYFRVIDATRFVLNIRKAGYGLISQIYDRNIIGGHWTLTRATVLTRDPTLPIDVTDGRDDRNCPGPLSCRLNWRDFPLAGQPQWQDGSNNIIPALGPLEVPLPSECKSNTFFFCGPGIRVQIPANSLVDQNGAPPTGNVSLQLFTIDLNSPFQMPGDYTVRQSDGSMRVMESYGAGSVEITAGSRRYNLKAGATAQVTIPVDPGQLAAGGTIPPTIPVLFYNETTGVWAEEGTATLVGNVYVATVAHFSTINTDQVKQNQSCVRIISPPPMPATYNLEYQIPRPGQAPVRNTVLINNAPPHRHVIYNLPSMVNIVLVPIDPANNTPIGTFVVNTGGPQNPTSPNLPNDPPTYAACSTEVTFTPQTIPELPNSGEFLHGLYTFEAVNLTELTNGGPDDDPVLAAAVDQSTANYYQQIDPMGKRLTLNGSTGNDVGFRAANGFPTSEINVIYANSADLGFGRNMHGVKNGLDTAAYVSNFGDIDTPDANDVADAVLNGNPVATVAMEYSPIEGDPSGDRVVKFYVYNNLGNRVNSANLDKLGSRPVPQLCMVCHGGEYPSGPVIGSAAPFNSVSDVKLGSKYLPFDLHYYVFAPAPNDKATQQPKFKQFNEDIVKNSPPLDPVIGDIITQMYVPGPDQNENFVVAGWNAQPMQQTMYRDVLGRTCRTCHAAHSFPALNFNLAQQLIDRLGQAEIRVCDQHVMPHSKVTHKLFWTSVGPHQPAVFQLFGDTYKNGLNGWDGTLCGNYTPGGQTPVTDFTTKVQPVFTSKCAVCHSGGSPPPNCKPMNLSSGNAYANIVNVKAGELATMNRITGNDHNQSYLWHKVNGTQGGLPGLNNACNFNQNQQMPPPSGGLSATEITDITSWIDTGAQQ